MSISGLLANIFDLGFMDESDYHMMGFKKPKELAYLLLRDIPKENRRSYISALDTDVAIAGVTYHLDVYETYEATFGRSEALQQ